MVEMINKAMSKFRLASRELYNNYFFNDDPAASHEDFYLPRERFIDLQSMLFSKLVLEPCNLADADYGSDKVIKGLYVVSASDLVDGGGISALVNRDQVSGYWDYPLQCLPPDAQLGFVRFFDWDQRAVMDNQLVRAEILSCESVPEIVGKHVLIEAGYVTFA